jgi:hypothetical protein
MVHSNSVGQPNWIELIFEMSFTFLSLFIYMLRNKINMHALASLFFGKKIKNNIVNQVYC